MTDWLVSYETGSEEEGIYKKAKANLQGQALSDLVLPARPHPPPFTASRGATAL